MGSYQIHHVIPLSLLGPDWDANKITLESGVHKEVHKLLDVKYQAIRKFRKRTNHLALKPNALFCEELCKLHMQYFRSVGHLAPIVLQMHADAMQAVYEKACIFYLRKAHIALHYDDESRFLSYLNGYHAILRDVAKYPFVGPN